MTTDTIAATIERPVGYAFGSGPRGVLLGLAVRQLLLLGLGLAGAVGVLLGGGPLPVALTLLPAALTLACLPVGGRVLLDWATPVRTAAQDAVAGRRDVSTPVGEVAMLLRWQPGHCGAPELGLALASTATRQRSRPAMAEWSGLQVQSLDPAPGETFTGQPAPAVIVDRAHGRLVLLLEVAGLDRFGLLEPSEQDRQLHSWGQALSVLSSGTDLIHVSLLDRVSPADPRAQQAWMRNHQPRDADAADGSRAGMDGYDALLQQVARRSTQRTGLLALALRLPSQRGDRRHPTGGLDSDMLRRRLADISRTLLSAQLSSRPLPADQIEAVLEAHVHGGTAQLPVAHADTAALSLAGPRDWWPLTTRRRWDHVRTDDTFHRSFIITGWPRQQVGAGWLTPLLLVAPAGCARTLALHLRPVPPEQASRIARTARTRALLDHADRQRLALSGSAAVDAAASAAEAFDGELVAGHACHRLVGLITISAPSLAELEQASSQLRDGAGQARLQLAPTHGQHPAALVGTAPLCRLRAA